MDVNKKVQCELRPGFNHMARVEGKNKRLQPGEKVELTYAQYRAFRDRFVLAEVKEAETKAKQTEPKPEKEVKSDGQGKYDVFGPDGKKLNEQPLTKVQAEAMAKA